MNSKYRERGVSHTFGVLLLISIAVILSVIVAFYPTEVNLSIPKFSVLSVHGKIVPHKTGMAKKSQIIRIEKTGGEARDVSELLISVEILRDGRILKRESCKGFPVSTFKDAICSGDDIIDKSVGYNTLGELSKKSDGIFEVGEFIGFRIKKSGIQLRNGDVIHVKVIDTQSKFLIAELREIVEG